MSDRTMYAELGLEPGVPSAEIRKAYRNLTLRLHPDASGNPATAERFCRVARAYKTLSVKAAPANAAEARRGKLPEPLAQDLFALGAALSASRDAAERATAARRLGLSGKRSAWVFLRRGMYDPDPRVVGACVRAASALGLAQGAAEVAGAYSRAGPEARDSILEAARATRDAIFSAALEAAAVDEDPRRRLAALELSGRGPRRWA